MAGTKIYDDDAGPVKIIDSQTLPATGDKALVVTGNVTEIRGTPGTVFGASTGSISAGTQGTENPRFLLRNPASSGIKLKVTLIEVGVLTENRSVKWNLYLNPTITADGTPLTEVQLDTSSGESAVGLVFSLPTISANGNLFKTLSNLQNNNSKTIELKRTVIIDEGDALLITCNPIKNNVDVALSAEWAEE